MKGGCLDQWLEEMCWRVWKYLTQSINECMMDSKPKLHHRRHIPPYIDPHSSFPLFPFSFLLSANKSNCRRRACIQIPIIIAFQLMTHIQKAVHLVDDRGKYQFVLVGILILIYMQLGLILLGSSFVYMNPTWDCPEISNPTEDQACRNPLCRITNDFTATHYADLYCDGQDERSLIQSAIYIGSIIGLLVLTPFADSKGKKKIFVLSQSLMIMGIAMNLVGVYAKTAAVIVVGQILVGSGCYSVLIIGYVIISELAEDRFKQYSIIILNAVWALTQVIIAGFYFWFNYWRNYLLFIQLIPNIVLLVISFFYFVESPYFLIEKKRDIQGAMASMRKIAAVNGVGEETLVTVQEQLRLALEEVERREKEETGKQANTPKIDPRFAIFKDWKHLKILLVVAVFEFGVNAYYYGVQFSLGQIGTDFGYNILLTGLIETTAYFTSNLFITKVPRRLGGLGFNLICILLGLLFFFDFGIVMQTVLLGACRFFNTYNNAIVPMMQNEPFPHHYRSVAWGYIEGLSQIGNFITPYIVTACQNAAINPLIVFSFLLSVIGTVPLLFYRETQGISEDQLVANEEQEEKAKHLKESIQTDGSIEGPLLRDANNKDL